MYKLITLITISCGFLCCGCQSEIGGPKLDNTSGTYVNDMEAKKLNYLTSPAPKEAAIP